MRLKNDSQLAGRFGESLKIFGSIQNRNQSESESLKIHLVKRFDLLLGNADSDFGLRSRFALFTGSPSM